MTKGFHRSSLKFSFAFLVLIQACSINGDAKFENDYSLQPDTVKIGMSRVALFRSLPADSNEIIMLGDSRINGFLWHEYYENSSIKNRGIGGDITKGVLHRLDEVTRDEPTHIILQIGVNDVYMGFHPDSIYANICRVAERIGTDSPKSELIICSIIPTSFSIRDSELECTERIDPLNKRLRSFCDAEEVKYLDLDPYFKGPEGLHQLYDVGDGLHLNTKGYEVWAELLRPFLGLE